MELTSTGTAIAANLTLSGGNLTNAAGGTFNVLAGSGGTRTLTLTNAQFLNQSALNLNGANLTVAANSSTAFTNDVNGALAVAAGTTLTDAAGLTNNGVLTGAGTVTANILGTGTISPGQTPGLLPVNGNVSLGGFVAELNGTTAGTQYDQLAVNGAVTLAGPLTTTLGYTPAPGDVLTIINNDGTDAVTGKFTGLPQGAMVNIGGTAFTISYTGGTGNDVTLGIPTPPPTVTSVQVNGGAAQQLERDESVNVTFSRVVSLPAQPHERIHPRHRHHPHWLVASTAFSRLAEQPE